MIITKKEIRKWAQKKVFEEAEKEIQRQDFNVIVHSIDRVSSHRDDEMGFRIEASVKTSGDRRSVLCEIGVFPSGLHYAYCYELGHTSYARPTLCIHTTIILLELLDFFKENPIKQTNTIIDEAIQQISMIKAESDLSVRLEPVIVFNEYEESLSCEFKVGDEKLYFIKNLSDFIVRFTHSSYHSYGKDLAFIHMEKNIKPESKPTYDLIKTIVNEVTLYDDKKNRYNYSNEVGKALKLSYSVMDNFFDLYKDRTLSAKPKEIKNITLTDGLPEIVITLNKMERFGEEVVSLETKSAVFIEGIHDGYIFDKNTLYRVPRAFFNSIFLFIKKLSLKNTPIYIDSADMQRFYAKVYPLLEKYTTIVNNDFDVTEYAPPETKTTFYLDYKDKEIQIEPYVQYDNNRFLIGIDANNGYRDDELETNIIAIVSKYFYMMTDPLKIFIPSHEEEKMYNFLKDGLPVLENMGEVLINENFKKINLTYSPKVSVGVRLQSDLLNIDIDTENIDMEELDALLKSYKTKKKYHRLKDGQFMDLQNKGMETLSALTEGLNMSAKELAQGSFKVPAFRALYLDKLLAESDDVNYDRDRHVRNLLRDFKIIEDSEYPIPEPYETILREYQKTGYQWLKTLDHYHFGGILADDMGLGKTLQMIVFLYDAYLQQNKTEPTLIVTPASLVYNWETEFKRFAPELKIAVIAGNAKERTEIIEKYTNYQILITSYDLLKRDVVQYESKQFYYQIIDEGQYIKNSSTLQAKAAKAILAKQRFALTGTPIENRLSELWSIFDFLMPGFLYPYKTFKNEFETEIIKHKNENKVQRLQKMIAPFVLRRLKKDVLKELPDKIEKTNMTQLEGEQKKLYESYAAQVKMKLGRQNEQDFNKSKIQVLSDLMRLRQLCCDPSLVYENYTGGSMKLNQCMELVQNCVDSNHKILLFSQFTSMLDILKKELDQRGIASYTIKGETSKEKRMQFVNQFNVDDTPVFLISLKAGGTGLNLTGADVVIHYDPWWNIAAQNQATDRAHRIGQRNVVTVYQMVTKGTIEEKILKLQESKQELVNQVLSGENTSLTTLSKDEILDILS